MIFLISPKTLFLGHFWQFLGLFCLMGIFSKKSGCHIQLYMAPNIMQRIRKTEPISRKPKDRQKKGQKDRQTLFYRTLPDEVGGPISLQISLQISVVDISCSIFKIFLKSSILLFNEKLYVIIRQGSSLSLKVACLFGMFLWQMLTTSLLKRCACPSKSLSWNDSSQLKPSMTLLTACDFAFL